MADEEIKKVLYGIKEDLEYMRVGLTILVVMVGTAFVYWSLMVWLN